MSVTFERRSSSVFPLVILCMALGAVCVLMPRGDIVEAGFSDNLLGKGKPPAAESASKAVPPKGTAPVVPSAPEVVSTPGSAREPGIRVPGGQTVGSFDIVGLRLGMTQEEAVELVLGRRRELNGKPIVFEILNEGKHEVLVQGDVPRTKFVALSDAKSVLRAFDLSEEPGKNPTSAQDPKIQRFAAGGQIEAFGIQFPNVPNEPRVSGITRVQRLAPPVLSETVRGALIQKYGTPTIEDKFVLIWLTDQEGRLMTPASREIARCRGFVLPPGSPVEQADYSMFAMKGCGDQLSVQLQGSSEAVMMIRTSLIHHQQLVDYREATKKAALAKFGLSPEQTKNAPAPQF